MKNTTPLATLRDERLATVNELKVLADLAEVEGRSFTSEEITRYDALDAQQTELNAQIQTLERSEKVRALHPNKSELFGSPVIKVSGKQITRSDYNNAFKAWALHGHTDRTPSDLFRRAADRLEVDWTSREYICRAQSSDVDAEGGHSQNDSTVINALVEARKAYGQLESVAEVITTQNGENLHFVVNDDTASLASVGTAQNTLVDNTGLTYTRVNLGCHDYKTAVYPVSLQLIEDAHFDVASHVGKALGLRLGRKLAIDMAIGDGSNKCRGFTLDTTSGVIANSAFSVQDLYDLYFSVNSVYRPNAVWLMNDVSLAYIASLQDDIGRPLFNDLHNDPTGQMLLGKRVIVIPEMDSPEESNAQKPIVFGDASSIKIRYVGGPRILRDDSRYVDTLSVGFFGWQRADSRYVPSGGGELKHMSTGTLSGG